MPMLRQLVTTNGYSFFSNGHWYALKGDGRCVQFDFAEETVEMSPRVFEGVLEAIRRIIQDF
jgi:hypothetical protein